MRSKQLRVKPFACIDLHKRTADLGLVMRVVSLSPVATKYLLDLGVGEQIVGVTHRCRLPEELSAIARVTEDEPGEGVFSDFEFDEQRLENLQPTHLVSIVNGDPTVLEFGIDRAIERLRNRLVQPALKVFTARPVSLDQLFQAIEQLGTTVDRRSQGQQMVQKLRAQFMNWADAFYDRMKNKRVTVLSGIAPFTLAGDWVPDLIALASGISQAPRGQVGDAETSWEAILQFRPDVLLVAPRGRDMKAALATFKELERTPGWEDALAVKRGDVSFCDGVTRLYDLSYSLVDSVSVLFSCMAGFDSGYIAPRESFYRLRWLELQRHRL